jgi:hypothetical protein
MQPPQRRNFKVSERKPQQIRLENTAISKSLINLTMFIINMTVFHLDRLSRPLIFLQSGCLVGPMVIPYPMPLVQQAEPFDDEEWFYEIKHDGFRAWLPIERE